MVVAAEARCAASRRAAHHQVAAQDRARYTTTVDRAFPDVLAACADPKRPDGWIDDRIAFAYTALHQAGYVHSVETWDSDGRLVGGLYGVHQGGMFAGESMFHHSELGRDASKVALLRLWRNSPGPASICWTCSG